MRWRVAIVAITGCSGVLGVTAVSPMPDASVFTPCANALLIDDFTETTPCAPWGALSVGSNGTAYPTVTEGSGALTFMLPNGTSGKCKTTTDIALPAGGVLARVDQQPGGGSSSMSLESAGLGAELYFYSNLLNLSAPGGSPIASSVQFNGQRMRYWRLMGDPARNVVIASYSPDGLTWTDLPDVMTVAAIPATIDVQLKADAKNSGSNTQAIFSYLLACP